MSDRLVALALGPLGDEIQRMLDELAATPPQHDTLRACVTGIERLIVQLKRASLPPIASGHRPRWAAVREPLGMTLFGEAGTVQVSWTESGPRLFHAEVGTQSWDVSWLEGEIHVRVGHDFAVVADVRFDRAGHAIDLLARGDVGADIPREVLDERYRKRVAADLGRIPANQPPPGFTADGSAATGLSAATAAQSACRSCGKPVTTSMKFCGACGTKIDRLPAVAVARFCTGCGRALSDGARFCGSCGTRVEQIAPS